MVTEFKRYGFVELDYLSIGKPVIFTQSNYQYTYGTCVSITGWESKQAVNDLSHNCLVAAWHLKGTHQFNNSLNCI